MHQTFVNFDRTILGCINEFVNFLCGVIDKKKTQKLRNSGNKLFHIAFLETLLWLIQDVYEEAILRKFASID